MKNNSVRKTHCSRTDHRFFYVLLLLIAACLCVAAELPVAAQIPQIEFPVSGGSGVEESANETTVVLNLSGPIEPGASVDYAVTGGTASSGYDFSLLGSGRLSLRAPGSVALTQSSRLTAPDAGAGDWFGDYLVADGDTIVIGAPFDDYQTADAGSAYVYVREGVTWALQTKLGSNVPQYAATFGGHLGIDQDTIAVGARYEDSAGTDSGAAYVYSREGTSWVMNARMVPLDNATGNQFGSGVAVSGDTLIVGCWQAGDADETIGHAYVYGRDTDGPNAWGQVRKLSASDPQNQSRFGVDVDVEGDIAVVGATLADGAAAYTGAVYIFERNSGGTNNWGQTAKISASDGAGGDNFGVRVSLNGDYLAVGAEQSGSGVSGSGHVYIFKRTNGVWTQMAKLSASDGAADDRFGWYLNLSGDKLAVGAVQHDFQDKSNAGAVYVFQRTGETWSETEKLVSYDVSSDDCFGSGVAWLGNTLVAGASHEDAAGDDAGAIYAFDPSLAVNLISVAIHNDDVDELDETVQITLSNPVGVTLGAQSTWTITIADDDLPGESPVVAFAPNAITEIDEMGGLAVLDLKLSGGQTDKPVSVDYAVTSGTATGNGEDYTLLDSGTVHLNTHASSDWGMQSRLVPNDLAAGDWFGDFVAIDGKTAVVAAINDRGTNNSYQSGSVYVYGREGNQWVQQAKLPNPDPQSRDWFGIHVTISGDTIGVGARYDDEKGIDAGAAYMYRREGNAWNLEAKVTADDAQGYDQFASGLALSGNLAAVGSWQADSPNEDFGHVYVLERNYSSAQVWTQVKKLASDDIQHGDRFGVDVDIDGDTLIAGATTADTGATDSGAAYIFQADAGGIDNWGQVQKLVPDDPQPGDNFGVRVAICGNLIAVGSEQSGMGANGSGCVYLYKRKAGAWELLQKIVPSDGQPDDRFGWYLALTENHLAVSAVKNDGVTMDCGAVYVFQRGAHQWSEITKIAAPNPEPNDFFGSGVAFSGGTLLVGARYKNEMCEDSGAAYFYEKKPGNTISLAINSDRVYEADETVEITLSNPQNAVLGSPSKHTLTIVDDDTPPSVTLSQEEIIVDEKNGRVKIPLKLSGKLTAKPVSVHYATQDGLAKAGQDYVAANGTLTFSPTIRRQYLDCQLVKDANSEGWEDFDLVLSDEENASLGISRCTVRIKGEAVESATDRWELYE